MGHVEDKESINRSYGELAIVMKRNLQDRRNKRRTAARQDATAAFGKRYAQHEMFPEYRMAKHEGNNSDWIRLQREILRAEWKTFRATAQTGDLRKVFQYLARQVGRAQPHLRPACLGPINHEGQLILGTQ